MRMAVPMSSRWTAACTQRFGFHEATSVSRFDLAGGAADVAAGFNTRLAGFMFAKVNPNCRSSKFKAVSKDQIWIVDALFFKCANV
jgi:hypothetical protein